MENEILNLFEKHFSIKALKLSLLPASGSSRKYFRIHTEQASYIAAYHLNVRENELFIDFSRHFKAKGLSVPEIYAVSEDGLIYIQEDLGDTMLLNVVEQERVNAGLSNNVMELYRKALSELLRFQLLGNEGLDYTPCIPRPVFDAQCIRWDLNYFKYCYLRLAGVDFSEQQLEDDFEQLTAALCCEDTHNFMFRDFQSRNIMIKEDKVWFIDYQGGRQGALAYDVASLLYDAIAQIPEQQREELLDYYIQCLETYRPVDRAQFRITYYRFALIRLLQAMGAFGLRGLYERKPHFIDSIAPGLQNILSLFSTGKLAGNYPTIEQVCRKALAAL